MTHSPSTNKGWASLQLDDNPIPGDVEACVRELGIEIHKIVRDELWARCPGHLKRKEVEDRDPSWSVVLEDQYKDDGDIIPAGSHNCFSCGYKGSFVRLVKDVLDVDWDEAAAWVRARGGILRVKKILSRRQREEVAPQPLRVSEADLALFVEPPQSELNKRLISVESARKYGVLWNPDRGSYIIPIRDPDTDKLLGWQEKSKSFYQNQPDEVPKSRTLFGYREVPVDAPVILLESPLDVLRLDTVGIMGGVASYGVHVSDEQMRLIQTATDTIIFALDNDKDGRLLSKQLRHEWRGRGLQLYFINYSRTDAKDVGEMGADEIFWALSNAYNSLQYRRV